VFDFLNELADWLGDISSSPWFYLVILVIALLDSVVPVVPSETSLILGGLAAGRGDLFILFVIAAGAIGAFTGDSIAYGIGRRFRKGVTRLVGGRKGAGEERMSKAADQLDERGGMLLITARFIPGGRTLMTITCGATERSYRNWFIRWDALAAILWAVYGALIGFFFGEIVEDNDMLALILALGTALTITGLIEIVRWFRHRNEDSADGGAIA